MSESETRNVVVSFDELGFVVGYGCPSCRTDGAPSPVKLRDTDGERGDGAGTKWFVCEKCGQHSRKLKSKESKALENEIEYWNTVRNPATLEEIEEILDTTIKRDTNNKVITFLTMLLTYTDEDQINVSFTAESSTGKSYIPLELAWYFPSEDVIEYSYVSPTAFFHEYGTFLPDPSDRRDVEPEKKRKIKYIDLKQKILIFIDQPHDLLLQRLRPLLSHDRRQLVSKITDPSRKSGLHTKTVVIEGYPTVLFCTAKFSMEQQERTRLLLLSPDTTEEKIKDAILLRIQRESNREAFRNYMESDKRRNWLRNRVFEIAKQNVKNIIIPEDLRNKVVEEFFSRHSSLIPRHQRDIGRVLALIKACALLNCWHREKVEESIIASERDVQDGFRLYGEVSTANELGLPPEAYNVFEKLKDKIPNEGATRKEFAALHYDTFRRTIGKKRLEETLNLLLAVGLITEEPDPNDRRQKKFLVIPQGVFISKAENNGQNEGKAIEKINTPRPMTNFLTQFCSVCHEEKPLDQMSSKTGKPTCKRCAGEEA